MKSFRSYTVDCDEGFRYHALCRSFESLWNRRHSEPMKDQHLLLREGDPVAKVLTQEFEEFNRKNGNLLSLRVEPRVTFDRADIVAAKFFHWIPTEMLDLVKEPEDPGWVYRAGSRCTECGGGDPLKFDDYISRLDGWGIRPPRGDFATTQEFVWVLGEQALRLVEIGLNAEVDKVELQNIKGLKGRAREKYFAVDWKNRLHAFSSRTEIEAGTSCGLCNRVKSRVIKGAIYISSSNLPEAEIVQTDEVFGSSGNCEWMSPVQIITKKANGHFSERKLKGYRCEPCLLA